MIKILNKNNILIKKSYVKIVKTMVVDFINNFILVNYLIVLFQTVTLVLKNVVVSYMMTIVRYVVYVKEKELYDFYIYN